MEIGEGGEGDEMSHLVCRLLWFMHYLFLILFFSCCL